MLSFSFQLLFPFEWMASIQMVTALESRWSLPEPDSVDDRELLKYFLTNVYRSESINQHLSRYFVQMTYQLLSCPNWQQSEMRDHTLGAFYKKMSEMVDKMRKETWGAWIPFQFCISMRELGWRHSGEVLEINSRT
jgi:hypothetical protein